MNIRKKLAVVAAVALPMGGLALFGGVQAASAGGPPILTCPQLQPDPTPLVAGAQGTTFDTTSNGSAPGSAGLYISANAGSTTTLNQNAFDGNTTITINALAITNQTLTITGASGTYTVVSDSTPLGHAFPATLQVTPAVNGIPLVKGVGELKAKVTTVTVNPTVNTPNRTVGDGVTSGTDLSSATANFTGADVGLPVQGSSGGANAFSGVSPTIATVNSTTDVTLSASASINASGVVVTIGNTNTAPANVYGDFDFQGTQCTETGWTTVPGVFAPTSVILKGENTGIANSAIALEGNPAPLNLTATYPAIGAGWADEGGTIVRQPSTSISFASVKFDKFVLLQNSYLYAGGSATGTDYQTTKASMGLAANGAVICTLAQLQAITLGTGEDHSTVPLGGSALEYCDGGGLSSLTPAQALGNLINLELDPHASVYGSDGSSLAAIWGLDAGPNGNTVI